MAGKLPRLYTGSVGVIFDIFLKFASTFLHRIGLEDFLTFFSLFGICPNLFTQDLPESFLTFAST